MGSFLMVEAGYETGQLMARLRTHGGKALLSFLLALFSFCNTGESTDMDLDKESLKWFKRLSEYSDYSIISTPIALIKHKFRLRQVRFLPLSLCNGERGLGDRGA